MLREAARVRSGDVEMAMPVLSSFIRRNQKRTSNNRSKRALRNLDFMAQ
jgi:hypothetical protein